MTFGKQMYVSEGATQFALYRKMEGKILEDIKKNNKGQKAENAISIQIDFGFLSLIEIIVESTGDCIRLMEFYRGISIPYAVFEIGKFTDMIITAAKQLLPNEQNFNNRFPDTINHFGHPEFELITKAHLEAKGISRSF